MTEISTNGQASGQSSPAATPDAGRAKAGRPRLRPLATLIPFATRYSGRVTLAFVSLLVAAIATLAVPLAVRRMIDFGFSGERIGLIDQYFGVMIVVAAVLAIASASRFYLVSTIGESFVMWVNTAARTSATTRSPMVETR